MRLFPLLLTTVILVFGLTGCGQKGPLYLPQPSEQQPVNDAAQP